LVLNENSLAEALSARFRLELTGCVVSTKEGKLYGVRAADIPSPNGFMILVRIGWKSIEADFVPDTYAGELVRAMGNSLSQTRQAFSSLAEAFEEMGNRIKLSINGSLISTMPALPSAPWNKFQLNVWRLTNVAGGSEVALQKSAEEIAAACLALVLALLPLEEEDNIATPLYESGLPEGACTKISVNRYERHPVNRAACIAAHGAFCNVCGFDFGEVYGSLGHGYIEVHHRVPVSRMGADYIVDPIRDLVPLCSNCHAAVHRNDPPLDPEELIAIMAKTGARGLSGK
jgi:5-methylcytosine-specific restriction protein A